MTHPGAPRDVDLAEWFNRIKHHPPKDDRTALAHAGVRNLVANLGEDLHRILPPGVDKSLAFTTLKEVLMWANSAIAVGGASDVETDEQLRVYATGGLLPTQDAPPGFDPEAHGETAASPSDEQLLALNATDNLRSTHAVLHTSDPEVSIEVTGSRSSEVVQLAVLGTRERIQSVIGELGGNFTGLYASVKDPSELSGLLRKLSEAGEVAFRDAG